MGNAREALNQYCRLVVIAASLALSCAATASAQSQPAQAEKPFRGLFGGNEADPRSRQALNLQASFFGAYDDNVLADQGQRGEVPDPRYMTSGFYASPTASLDYRRRWGRVSFDSAGGTVLRYYPDMSDFNGTSEWVSVGFSAELTRRTTFRASQGVAYSPYHSYGWFPGLNPTVPGEVVRPDPDSALYRRSVFQYTTAVDLARRLTRRSSLNLFYNLNYADFTQSADVSETTLTEDFKTQHAGAGFSYSVTNHTSLRVGYSYQASRYGALLLSNQSVTGHNLEIGFEYARALARGRVTTFGVSTGASVTDRPYSSYLIDAVNNSTNNYYNVLVGAYLNQAIGRTWSARLSYNRGLQFVEGLAEPFFSDAVSATLRGYVGRRVSLTASAAYSNGAGIYSSVGRGFAAYTGTAQSQYALSRTVALSAQYFYYHYDINGELFVAPGLTRRFDRQGVHAGLSFWLPLLR